MRFWTRWLLVIWASMLILGLVLAFIPFVFVPNFLGPDYYNVYVPDGYDLLSDGDIDFQHFLYGVMGALMAAWASAMFHIVNGSFRRGEKGAWNIVAMSLLLWFMGDSYISIVTGFPFHAVLNLSLLAMIGLPLLMTRRYFFNPTQAQTGALQSR